LGLATLVLFASGSSPCAGEPGWKPLFNGKNLDGWIQRNGAASYRVEDGAIVGRTNEGSPNSFLCTTKDYANFELRFEVKVDKPLNSGVQIRSRSAPEKDNGRVHGPQVEIATNGTAGFIYGEALGTGWLSKNMDDPKAKAAFKRDQWNKYHIKAVDTSIKTWINDVPVADLIDDRTGMMSGFIGLQVHSIPRGAGPYEVRWRNLHIKEIR
jgi:hypothetical protein